MRNEMPEIVTLLGSGTSFRERRSIQDTFVQVRRIRARERCPYRSILENEGGIERRLLHVL